MRLIILFLLILLPTLDALAAAPFTTQTPQYLFLNRAPGQEYNQRQPESVTDRLFTEPFEAIGTRGTTTRKLGLSFDFSYLDGPPDKMEATLRRLLILAQQHDTPILIVLDGENWWDKGRPGYNPKNVANVEWTDWESDHAVKICWRNWGRQIRVLPQPNLASGRFRDASRRELTRLVRIIKDWAGHLPPEKRYLFPGVKIGWEASIGINAYYYPNGNSYLEQYPNDASRDPQTGLDMGKDTAGGVQPLGYAALTSKGWKHPGPITKEDQERIVTDYLTFLAEICHKAGLPRDKVYTHAGGQYAPYALHTSHRIAINQFSLPGWSLYGTFPDEAGDLGASLDNARLRAWAAAEWLPHASTPAEWRDACNRTLAFRHCRFLSLYNWEGIRGNAAAVEGVREALG